MPSLDNAGRRYGHDILDEDQLFDLMQWALQPNLSPMDLRAAAFVIMGLLYFARDDTLVGIQLNHCSWGKHGLRLFESRFKGHAETAGARVLYTPYSVKALTVLKRWCDYLESRQMQKDWPLWRLPWEKRVPHRKEHIGWVHYVLSEAGCHLPFEMKLTVHMFRATTTCHCLAIQVPRPTTQFRAGWKSMSSLDNYARPVLVGPTSQDLWEHLKQVLHTNAN